MCWRMNSAENGVKNMNVPCNAVMRPFAMLLGSTVFLVGAIDLTRRLITVFRH